MFIIVFNSLLIMAGMNVSDIFDATDNMSLKSILKELFIRKSLMIEKSLAHLM